MEETDHFLKHIKECSGCREDLEIYYTVRTAIDGMDQDRFKTYNLKQQFEHDMSQVARQVRAGLFIQWLHQIAFDSSNSCGGSCIYAADHALVLNKMIPGSKAPKAVRACTIRFLSLGPAKT